MGKKASTSRNNQRSNDRNPNNPGYKHSVDNRSRQLNPEHPTYHSGRKTS